MNENRVVSFRQEDEIDDPLTEILRTGARRLITRAVEIEFDTFLASNADLALPDGRQRVVRHGHDPVRTVQTGIGPVDVQKPKARDRGAPEAGERIRFTSAILPKWARRAPASSLFTREFDGRFPGGSHGLARQGRAESLAGGERAAQGRVGRRISAVAKARSVGASLCLRLGGWRLSSGAHGAAGRMHAGSDRGHSRGQEGVDRLPDGHAGERAELEENARRFEGARLINRAGGRRRRWCAWFLESSR